MLHLLRGDSEILTIFKFYYFSDPGLNISHFNRNVFKKNVDQEITGKWKFASVNVKGNLNLPSINNLTFPNDVLTAQQLDSVVITGHKKFKNLRARNVKASFINDINLADWFFNSVKLREENQKVEGKVTLHNAVFYNDIEVKGLVNDFQFNAETVLTKSTPNQVIQGDLIVKTKTTRPMKILKSIFNQLFLSNSINGINFTDFFENSLKRQDREISTDLIFDRPLNVEELETNGFNIYDVNMGTFLSEMDVSTKLQNYEKNLGHLNELGVNLIGSFEGKNLRIANCDICKRHLTNEF